MKTMIEIPHKCSFCGEQLYYLEGFDFNKRNYVYDKGNYYCKKHRFSKDRKEVNGVNSSHQ